MICNNCVVAGYINEEINLTVYSRPEELERAQAMARSWHKKCLSWRGNNKNGCTCQHQVGNVVDQSKVDLEERKKLHEARRAQFGSIVGEIA